MPRRREVVQDLPGEVWKRIPGWPHWASSYGRIKSVAGLITPAIQKGIPRAVLSIAYKRKLVAVAVLVEAAWSERWFDDATVVFYRDGDRLNCRPENLSRSRYSRCWPGTREATDFPWSPTDDKALRRAKTCREALITSRHSRPATLTRIERLGITFSKQRPKFTLVEARDPEAVASCVEALEKAGIPSSTIRLALGHDRSSNWGQGPAVEGAITAALRELAGSGLPRTRIAEAFGWSASTMTRWLRRAGLADAFPRASQRGDGGDLAGEEWRQAEVGYWVSNMGRITGPTGVQLRSHLHKGGTPWVTLRAAGRSVPVAKLVLAAFKPALPYSYDGVRFLNGDRTDCRAENMVPAHITPEQIARVEAEARRLIRSSVEPDQRREILAATVAAVLDGRASDASSAYALARRETASLFDYRAVSLNAHQGDGGLSGLDRLSSDAEHV